MTTKELDSKYVASTYARFPVCLVSGKGSLVYDEDGKEYIDLGTGIAVNTFGYSDNEWIDAVNAQLSKLQHTSNLYYSQPCAALAALLCERTGMSKVFFSNSGAEANECAIKVARKYAFLKNGTEEKSKNSYDGTITVLAEDEKAVVNLENITVVNEKKGYVSGNISFEVEEQKYNLALTADENSQTVSTDIVVEGVNYGKIAATLSVGSGEAPSLPDKSAAYDIYSEDADFPSDYVEQEKMVEFAKEVLMNVGLDEATADELAVEFGDSIYYTYDAWEDDYGWDNEEFDFDEEYYDWDSEEFIDDSDIYWDEEFSDDMDIYWDEDFDIDMDDVEIPEITLDDIELS